MYRRVLFFVILIAVTFHASDKKYEHRHSEKVMPTLGCWFWVDADFEPEGYKSFIDIVSINSPFNYLTTSIRAPGKEVTDNKVYDQIKKAAKYAVSRDVPIIMDLDVRLARLAFESEYPDELQEMLILKEIPLSADNNVEAVVNSYDLSDHYTHNTIHYVPLKGELLRVFSYTRDSVGINPQTLKDITKKCEVILASKDSVHIRLPRGIKDNFDQACVMVSFTHLTPDVFAPHLMEFQRKIIEQYSDVQLAGVCKDEWGFPPNFSGNPEKNQFWYSKNRAIDYADRTNGRDLLDDCLLMHLGIKGMENERHLAINNFMEMSLQRNGELENDFYKTVKKVFGNNSIVATHPTWWPYPDLREFKKNGLDWWIATRDWAQTDELTPFSVRTALSKKWGSSVWYNMYYSRDEADYVRAVWSSALGGGRVNYHQPYPVENPQYPRVELLRGNLMRAESRVRLLNYISQSPLDCPVAVVFGHTSAMNWAGPRYNDVGIEVADNLWREGFPTDLIPSSEIENNSLYIDKDGWICYGKQRYTAVVLYHPEFEKSSTADFFNKAESGPTKLYRVGNWTYDFEGITLNEKTALPKNMLQSPDAKSIISDIILTLRKQNIFQHTPANSQLKGFEHTSSSPPTTGFCQLIDGTHIQIAGTDNVAGDTIISSITIDNHEVLFDAIGVAAIRLDDEGNIEALAAGGLKQLIVGDFEINLVQRTDIALWKNSQSEWIGVIQGWNGALEAELLAITKNWIRMDVPVPVSE